MGDRGSANGNGNVNSNVASNGDVGGSEDKGLKDQQSNASERLNPFLIPANEKKTKKAETV